MMEKEVHTPGPWEAAWESGDKDIYIGELGYADYRNCFARVDYDDVDHAEAEANARLIAAAPELLEALDELHAKAVVGTDAERYGALDKAWRAITKARGEAS